LCFNRRPGNCFPKYWVGGPAGGEGKTKPATRKNKKRWGNPNCTIGPRGAKKVRGDRLGGPFGGPPKGGGGGGRRGLGQLWDTPNTFLVGICSGPMELVEGRTKKSVRDGRGSGVCCSCLWPEKGGPRARQTSKPGSISPTLTKGGGDGKKNGGGRARGRLGAQRPPGAPIPKGALERGRSSLAPPGRTSWGFVNTGPLGGGGHGFSRLFR